MLLRHSEIIKNTRFQPKKKHKTKQKLGKCRSFWSRGTEGASGNSPFNPVMLGEHVGRRVAWLGQARPVRGL